MKASDRAPPLLSPQQAEELEKARASMLARHKLIEAMIRNNELQLKNESARGGAEIERARLLRDAANSQQSVGAEAEMATLATHIAGLEETHQRLVLEREWLNASLLEFDSGPSAAEHQRSGHA